MKHLGLIGLALLIPVCIYILWRWPAQWHRSFSQHIVLNRTSQLLFAWSFTLSSLLYFWFLVGWLGPRLEMGWLYHALAVVIICGQLILAWVPATEKRSLLVHNIASLGAIISMLLLSLTLILFAPLSGFEQVVSIVFLLFGLSLIILYKFVPRTHANFLFYEIGYFVLFWAMITAITYT